MSYEGSREFIFLDGRYGIQDCNTDNPPGVAWWHSIDHTNGVDPEDPNTFPAAKKEVGFLDDWKLDHHGNKYAIKIRLYEPASKEWKRWRG
jgi:hypothetical protein